MKKKSLCDETSSTGTLRHWELQWTIEGNQWTTICRLLFQITVDVETSKFDKISEISMSWEFCDDATMKANMNHLVLNCGGLFSTSGYKKSQLSKRRLSNLDTLGNAGHLFSKSLDTLEPDLQPVWRKKRALLIHLEQQVQIWRIWLCDMCMKLLLLCWHKWSHVSTRGHFQKSICTHLNPPLMLVEYKRKEGLHS